MSSEIVGVYIDAAGNQVTVETSKAATSPEVETSSETSAIEEKHETEAAEAEKPDATTESDSDEEVAEDSEETEKAPKKKSGFEKRIEKLNKKATAAEMRAAELEARLAALEKPATDAPSKAADTDHGLVKPRAEDFDTNADYVEALYEFAAKKSAAQAQADKEASERAEIGRKAVERFDEAKKLGAEKFEDFEDVTDLSDFGMKPTPVFTAFLQDIEDPSTVASLMYHLGTNRDEFSAILKMPEIQAIKALTRIESRLAAEASPPAQKAEPEVKVTKAPEPIKPVSGAKSTKVARITDDMPYDDWRRIRLAEKRARK